jgi:hypothetical protein
MCRTDRYEPHRVGHPAVSPVCSNPEATAVTSIQFACIGQASKFTNIGDKATSG